MRILVENNSIKLSLKNNKEKVLNLGTLDIRKHGFQVVDHIVDQVIASLTKGEEVFLENSSLEAGMIGRKIEDKIKREVIILNKTSLL